MTFLSGEKYNGLWYNGMREGKGVYTYPDGTKYIGFYKDDLRHGEGKVYVGSTFFEN